MATVKPRFRKINSDFLCKTGAPEVKIYIKKNVDGVETFAHDTTYSTATHHEIMGMIESSQDGEFFVNEGTIVQHYGAQVKKLREGLGAMGTGTDQLKAIYALSEEIMLEYFEKIDSPRILRAQDDLVDALDQCLVENKFGFLDIYKITNKDNNISSHCVNVGLYCMSLGMGLQMPAPARKELFLGGIFSDIGKTIIPDKIRSKSEKLTPEEFKEVRKHPAASRKVLNDMKCYSESILRMTGEHHEKFNGQGYPRGTSGENIALQARICALIDVFSALTSDRPHRVRFGPMDVFSIMKKDMVGSFDDRIFANLIKMLAPATPQKKTPI